MQASGAPEDRPSRHDSRASTAGAVHLDSGDHGGHGTDGVVGGDVTAQLLDALRRRRDAEGAADGRFDVGMQLITALGDCLDGAISPEVAAAALAAVNAAPRPGFGDGGPVAAVATAAARDVAEDPVANPGAGDAVAVGAPVATGLPQSAAAEDAPVHLEFTAAPVLAPVAVPERGPVATATAPATAVAAEVAEVPDGDAEAAASESPVAADAEPAPAEAPGHGEDAALAAEAAAVTPERAVLAESLGGVATVARLLAHGLDAGSQPKTLPYAAAVAERAGFSGELTEADAEAAADACDLPEDISGGDDGEQEPPSDTSEAAEDSDDVTFKPHQKIRAGGGRYGLRSHAGARARARGDEAAGPSGAVRAPAAVSSLKRRKKHGSKATSSKLARRAADPARRRGPTQVPSACMHVPRAPVCVTVLFRPIRDVTAWTAAYVRSRGLVEKNVGNSLTFFSIHCTAEVCRWRTFHRKLPTFLRSVL